MKNDEGKISGKKCGYPGHSAKRNHIESGVIARPHDPTVERLVQRKFFWHNHYSKKTNHANEKKSGKGCDFFTHPAKRSIFDFRNGACSWSAFFSSDNKAAVKMSGKKVDYDEHPSKIDHVGVLLK